MALTYAQLLTNIQNWAENDAAEFVTDIPFIISLAEIRIAREADLNVFRKSGTVATVAGTATITPPSDMVCPRYVRIQDGAYLLPKDESFIREFLADPDLEVGEPRYYATINDGTGTDEVAIAPTPDDAYTLEIGYTFRPTALSVSNTTTWLSTYAYDVLFYACMVEVMAYMKMEAQEQKKWTDLYERALGTLQVEEKRKRTDDYRSRERI